jgi:hypothetical protein
VSRQSLLDFPFAFLFFGDQLVSKHGHLLAGFLDVRVEAGEFILYDFLHAKDLIFELLLLTGQSCYLGDRHL